MATQVFEVDIDFDDLASIEGIEGYDQALFLVRQDRQPLGKVSLPVIGGRIDGCELRAAIHRDFWWWIDHNLREGRSRPDQPLQDRLSATVAVCTRERPDDLRRCLTAITRMPDDGQDILVVDNFPKTDDTRRVVEEFPTVRYVREDRRGLDAARNRALREATGEIVAFIDDDAVADAGWLRGLLEPFSSPMVQCVTGLTMPLELENAAQERFETFAGFSHRGFARTEFQWPRTDPLATGSIGAGANMALRRSVVAQIGEFDEALDAGTPSQSGGDHDYFSRILRAGFRIVYEPRALNWHRHRRTEEELRKAIWGYGVGVYAHWTRTLLVERQWSVIPRAWGWFIHDQAPQLFRSLVGLPTRKPRELLWAEFRGCWRGPFAYLEGRRQVTRG